MASTAPATETLPPIADSIKKQFDALTQEVQRAMQRLSSLSEVLDQREHALGVQAAEIKRQTEDVKTEHRDRDTAGAEKPSEDKPPHSTPPHTHVIDGECYIKKADYDTLLELLAGTKDQCNKAMFADEQKDAALRAAQRESELREEKFRRQSRELDMEKSKVSTYEKKLDKQRDLFHLFRQSIEKIKKKNRQAKRGHEVRCEKEAQWMREVLAAGTITASDFDRLPPRGSWPDFDTALTRLAESTITYMRRDRGLSLPTPGLTPPISSTADGPVEKHTPSLFEISPSAQEGKEDARPGSSTASGSTFDDPDATSDEEPESALVKFSPTSRAILRQPGAETLAVLHPGMYQPSQDTDGAVSQMGTKEQPVFIKREVPSQLDSYSKYGYNRLVVGDEETLDLDKVSPGRHALQNQADGNVATADPETTEDSDGRVVSPRPSSPIRDLSRPVTPVKAEPGNSPARSHRSPLQEIPQPNLRRPSEDGKKPDGSPVLFGPKPARHEDFSVRPSGGKKLASLLAKQTQDDKLPPVGLFKHVTPNPDSKKPRDAAAPKGKRSVVSIKSEKISIRERNIPTKQVGMFKVPATIKREAPGRQEPTPSKEKRQLEDVGLPTRPKKARTKAPINQNSDPFAISRYRINPDKNDGVDYAFTEVVRDKSKKACLPTCVKTCCKDLAAGVFEEMWQPPEAFKAPKFSAQDSSQPDEEEEVLMQQNPDYKQWKHTIRKTEQALKYGRHKAQHERAEEVKHFWTSEFLNTQQLEEQNADSERRYREKAFKIHDDAKRGGIYERRLD
ncbi:hypothetical protein Dda_8416 [Drechslerella dactyloides]|uniref:DNA endonuclease activator Ctp1 C-terminal domain-containing protein n=1 Tax=Drechslerella dactyloides TaxID=74499 RepID=A0AAD6NH93_DREDA|nr:hypothetical protein Dda_8416 [Drechslerella dactyloides]